MLKQTLRDVGNVPKSSTEELRLCLVKSRLCFIHCVSQENRDALSGCIYRCPPKQNSQFPVFGKEGLEGGEVAIQGVVEKETKSSISDFPQAGNPPQKKPFRNTQQGSLQSQVCPLVELTHSSVSLQPRPPGAWGCILLAGQSFYTALLWAALSKGGNSKCSWGREGSDSPDSRRLHKALRDALVGSSQPGAQPGVSFLQFRDGSVRV